MLIAADMEGVSGVVHWDHVTSSHVEYARFRRIMTDDVNAALRGALDGGAEKIVITDGHGNAKNIQVEHLDRRAQLNSGHTRALSMVQSIQDDLDAVMFVGYHARAGTQHAILDHTWSKRVMNVWLNGTLMGEIGLNAAVCGHFGAPVIMISGCQRACDEAADLLGPVEKAVVKVASGRMGAKCLTPVVAQEVIYAAARRAAERFLSGEGPEPFVVSTPVTLTVEFTESEYADVAAVWPGTMREGRRVTVTAENMIDAYRMFRMMA